MHKLALGLVGVLFSAAALAGEAQEAPATPPSFAAGDPVMARLALTADQAKKTNDLAAEYAKKSDALPREAKPEDRKALVAERNQKIREALTAEQQPKYDAGLKLMADYDEKVSKLQQETSRAMAATPRDDIEKRREVSKGYKEKRAALDAETSKALDEQVGKRPEPPRPAAKA